MINFIKDSNKLLLTVGSGKVAGQAVLVGASITGVCLSASDSNNKAVVATEGVFDLSVVGADDAGNASIAIGDKIYIDSGVLNVDATNGVLFGKALEAVSSGATTTIEVMLINA